MLLEKCTNELFSSYYEMVILKMHNMQCVLKWLMMYTETIVIESKCIKQRFKNTVKQSVA